MAAACVFHAGDPCVDDVCLANQPPLARIRGADSAGNLRVGARTAVLISAADSEDPELEPLTYGWEISDGCAGNVVGVTDDVELRLTGLLPDVDCSITLTVNDGSSDGTASAHLLVRDIGAHVSPTAPCIAAYDAASNAPQGTAGQPFCDMREALRAAADYQLAEVSLAAGPPHQASAGLLIDRSVTLRGGYTRQPTFWTLPTQSARSEITFGPASAAGSDATLRIAGASVSDTVKLENLAIFRTAACTGECALVDVTGTSLELVDLELGKSPRGLGVAVRSGAAGGVYYSVRAAGVDGPTRQRLSAIRVATLGATQGLASVGIDITDGMDAFISTTTIEEETHTATGIHLLQAGNVRIEASTIHVESDDSTDSNAIAVGVSDGDDDTMSIAGCVPSGSTTCGSTENLTIVGSTIDASRAQLGIAVAAFGTRTLVFSAPSSSQRSHLTVSAGKAYGILTMGTGNPANDVPGMIADGIDFDVSTTSSAGLSSVAVGWSDGYEAGNLTNSVIGLGSYRATLANAQILVKVANHDALEASGVILRDTRRGQLINVNVVLTNGGMVFPLNGFRVSRVAGVRLLRTANVTLTGGSTDITNLAATWVAGALVDGQMNAGNDDIAINADGATYGSTMLTVANTSLGGALAISNEGQVPLRACIGLFGTNGASISSQSIACQLGASTNESNPTMAGILAVRTRLVTVSDSFIGLTAASPTSAVRLIGIQDGSRRSGILGSSGLRITRNQITVDAPSTLAIGVRLSGKNPVAPVADGDTVVDNNVIHLAQSDANIGVLTFVTTATLAFNNVRVASCTVSDCASAFATGFYMMHPAPGQPVRLLANGFGVPDGSFAGGSISATPFAVEHADTGTGLGVSAVTDNLYGFEDTASGSSLLVRFELADTDEVISPAAHLPLGESEINAMADGAAEGNYPKPPVYCFDQIHGDPSGPQAARAVHITSDTLAIPNLRDIDGDLRSLPNSDAGADVLGLCPLF